MYGFYDFFKKISILRVVFIGFDPVGGQPTKTVKKFDYLVGCSEKSRTDVGTDVPSKK